MNFIHIKFCGWFQSRFATDPDPADDPRGTRGFSMSLPGEPDFDRIIRFQPEGTYLRSHIKQVIGVTVKAIYVDKDYLINHPLLGAKVNLKDNPVFKGENGIVAEDGLEPIIPFRLSISNSYFEIERSCPANPPEFSTTRPNGGSSAPGKIAEATKIYNFREVMEDRIRRLQNEVPSPVISKRIENIQRFSIKDPGDRIFNYAQAYSIELKGQAIFKDYYHKMEQQVDTESNWLVEFWMGGWDIDASCGFVKGYLSIPQL